MPNNNTILTVKNLSKSFLKKNEKNSGFFHQLQKICSQPKENEIIWALNDVSFELEKQEIESIFYRERPMFEKALTDNIVGPFSVELVAEESLIKNERTGKLRLLIDNRKF